MAGRRTNLALLLLLLVAFATGAVAYGIGTAWGRWVAVAHGIAAIGIVLLVPWKRVIVRRGLDKERKNTSASLALMGFVALTIAAGFQHSIGLLPTFGPVTAMQLHVIGAVGALVFGIWHVVTRRTRVHKTDLSRRNALKAAALVGVGTAAYAAFEGVLRVTSAPGADRRFTGSHEKGSGHPSAMPVTQWFDDRVPSIDVSTWALEVDDGRERTRVGYDELAAFHDGIEAIIDCTGGWYAEQAWTGLWLSRLLPDGIEGRSILVRSTTGYSRRFAPESASGLLLATRVGGRELSPGHGYPVRLVAPGRRGFWWVKWVASVEPSPLPPWAQLPFPIS